MIYLTLLTTFFKIGLFSIGGGYAMLTMIQQEVVDYHHWLSARELTDMIAISQMTPGPIAINAATFIGYRQAGFWGSVLTTLGVILPSLLLMGLLTLTYVKLRRQSWFNTMLKELRPLTIGLIGAAAVLAGKAAITDLSGILVFLASFFVSYRYKVNPVIVLAVAGLTGYLIP